MTVVSTVDSGGINLDHVTHWTRTSDPEVFRFHFSDGSYLDERLGTATADRIAAKTIPAPDGYELIRGSSAHGWWRQPVLLLYIDAVVGLIDAAGIEDHLSDDNTFLVTPNGLVFDIGGQEWPSVDQFIADKAVTS